MERSNQGDIFILDKKVPSTNYRRYRISSQSDALYTDLSAEENMKFYCRLYKVPKSERKSRIEKCLGLVNLNEDDKK